MDHSFDIFKQIQPVKPNDALYDRIADQILKETQAYNLWTKIAAIFLIGFLSFETYCIVSDKTNNTNTPINSLACLPDNMLYNE